MKTIWLSPTDYVSSDSTLQITHASTDYPGTIVTTRSSGDLKWVSLGLHLPSNTTIEAVIIHYQVSNPRSFISQIRLVEMSTPDQTVVRHDDRANLNSTSSASYSSKVNGFTSTAAVTLDLQLNFQDTGD